RARGCDVRGRAIDRRARTEGGAAVPRRWTRRDRGRGRAGCSAGSAGAGRLLSQGADDGGLGHPAPCHPVLVWNVVSGLTGAKMNCLRRAEMLSPRPSMSHRVAVRSNPEVAMLLRLYFTTALLILVTQSASAQWRTGGVPLPLAYYGGALDPAEVK